MRNLRPSSNAQNLANRANSGNLANPANADYSERNAVIGSSLDTLQAGTPTASAPATNSTTIAPPQARDPFD